MITNEGQERFQAAKIPGVHRLEFAMVGRQPKWRQGEFCEALGLGRGRVVLLHGQNFTAGAETSRRVVDVRSLAHDCLRDLGDQPGYCLNELNRRLIGRHGAEGFSCVTLSLLDDTTLRLEFVGAGGECVVLHANGTGDSLNSGLPLSVVESPGYSSQVQTLAKHDVLVYPSMSAATTDGSPLLGDDDISALVTAGRVHRGRFVDELNRHVRTQVAGPETYWQIAMLARAI